MKINIQKYSSVIIFLLLGLLIILGVWAIGKIDILMGSIRYLISRYDGKHYLEIAKNGYNVKILFCFLPIYPLIIKTLAVVTGNYESGALTINIFLLMISNYIFYRLLHLYNIKGKKLCTLIFLPAQPILVGYAFACVAEPLFVLLLLLSFYYFKKDKILFSSLFGMLAAMTKTVGTLLFFIYFLLLIIPSITNRTDTIFVRLLRSIKLKAKKIAFLFLIPLGLLGVFSYYYLVSGNFFIYMQAQSSWDQGLTFPFLGFFNEIFYQHLYFELAWIVMLSIYLFIAWYLVKQRFVDLAIYMIVFIAFYSCLRCVYDFHRFLSVLFPFPIGVGLLFSEIRRKVNRRKVINDERLK